MSRFGNRPDCAYFILLGLCGAAFLFTIGGIVTYTAFNPESNQLDGPHPALSHHHQQHHQHHKINNVINDRPIHLLLQDSATDTKTNIPLAIVGPLCLLIGVILTLGLGILCLRYNCDDVAETNISFLRLKENFDTEKNNYELLIPATNANPAATNSPTFTMGDLGPMERFSSA